MATPYKSDEDDDELPESSGLQLKRTSDKKSVPVSPDSSVAKSPLSSSQTGDAQSKRKALTPEQLERKGTQAGGDS